MRGIKMRIYKSVSELTGRTPLMELKNIEDEHRLCARVLAKLELFNPAGSTKDRVAKAMLDDAEAKGLLSAGGTIIEPTSGNTGIGLAAIGASRVQVARVCEKLKAQGIVDIKKRRLYVLDRAALAEMASLEVSS